MKKYFIAFFAFITLFACGTSLPPEQELQNFISWNEKFVDDVLAEPTQEFVAFVQEFERKPKERWVALQNLKKVTSELEKLIKEMSGMPNVSHSDIVELKEKFINTTEEQMKLLKKVVDVLEKNQNAEKEKWGEVKDEIEWIMDQIDVYERELERLEKRLKQKYPQK